MLTFALLIKLLELLLVILFSRLNYRAMSSILILGSNILVQLAHRSLIFSVGSRGTSANKPLRLLTMLFLGSRSHLISLSLSHTHTLARTHAHSLPHFQHRWDLHKNSVSERSLFTQRTSQRKRTNIDRRYTIAIPTYRYRYRYGVSQKCLFINQTVLNGFEAYLVGLHQLLYYSRNIACCGFATP